MSMRLVGGILVVSGVLGLVSVFYIIWRVPESVVEPLPLEDGVRVKLMVSELLPPPEPSIHSRSIL